MSNTVKEIAERIPAPLTKAMLHGTAQHHIAAWRQPYLDGHAAVSPLQCQQKRSWRQKSKQDLSAAAITAGIHTASQFPQRYAIHWAGIQQEDPNASPGRSPANTQRAVFLLIIPHTKAGPFPRRSNYRSFLALTRYAPSTTPPKRYLPAALVLVTATSSSWVEPSGCVTT